MLSPEQADVDQSKSTAMTRESNCVPEAYDISSKQCVAALFGQHCSISSLSTLRLPRYEIIAESGWHMIGGGEA